MVVVPWRASSCLLLCLVGTSSMIHTIHGSNMAQKVLTQTRRVLNLSSLLGSARKSSSPYERIQGHPVFQVTTPWGSPYMNMEKLSDMDEQAGGGGSTAVQSLSEEQNEYRTVALFFMEPDDVLGMYGEMKQMENMGKADIRILSSSLGKALRQASNLGNGLTTGMPPNALDGTFQQEEGGYLRYKIMPPKRQLYYAARCHGKERVGLFGNSPSEDAALAVMGNSALEGTNLMRRRDKRERKTTSSKTKLELQNAHMEGYCGIPVFYAPELRKALPWHKQLLAGFHHETPLFLNYEDLQSAWEKMKNKQQGKSAVDVPEKPFVEVFNLWDVLTSMEREEWKAKQGTAKNVLQQPLKSIQNRFVSKEQKTDERKHPDLNSITFIPSSRSIQYKEAISARGNGKARLRPMR